MKLDGKFDFLDSLTKQDPFDIVDRIEKSSFTHFTVEIGPSLSNSTMKVTLSRESSPPPVDTEPESKYLPEDIVNPPAHCKNKEN